MRRPGAVRHDRRHSPGGRDLAARHADAVFSAKTAFDKAVAATGEQAKEKAIEHRTVYTGSTLREHLELP